MTVIVLQDSIQDGQKEGYTTSQNEAESSSSRLSGGFRIALWSSLTAAVNTTMTVNSHRLYNALGPLLCTSHILTPNHLDNDTRRQVVSLSAFYRK